MKKILLILSMVVLLSNCSDKNKEIQSVNIDIEVSIKYINQKGENLFEIPNGYKEKDITIYHKVNGKWKKYYQDNLDFPKGIKMVNRKDGIYVVLFPSITLLDNNTTETKIEFSDTNFDIIKAQIIKKGASTTVTKVWYNNVLKKERMFKVVK